MKKFMSILLALAITLAAFAPASRAATDPAELKNQIEQTVSEFEAIENPTPAEQKIINKAKEVANDLENGISDRFNPDTIYDLDSIPARVNLLGRLVRAMRFASTELKDKVDAAHLKVAEYVFVGLVNIANPFASINDLQQYAEKFNALQAELLGYPDMGPNDVANIYKRMAFDTVLHKARFLRFNEFKNVSTESLRKLDKVILEATGIRLKPQTTVQELKDAEARLNAAIEECRTNGTERASQSEIKTLRSLVWEMRGKIVKKAIQESEMERARQISNEVAALMLQTRPAKAKVLAYTSEIQGILAHVK